MKLFLLFLTLGTWTVAFASTTESHPSQSGTPKEYFVDGESPHTPLALSTTQVLLDIVQFIYILKCMVQTLSFI